MTRTRTRRLSVGIALALAVALPGGVMAASSGTVDESLTVNNVLSLTLTTTSVNYGSLDPGQTSDGRNVGYTASGNVGWRLTVTGSDFVSGTNSMPATARQRDGLSFVSGVELSNSPTGASFTGSTVWTVLVPPTQKGGTYTGALTYTLSTF